MNENSIDAVFLLSLAGLICTAITLSIRFCYKSKCSEVECCCFKIKRNIEIEKEEDLTLNYNSDSPKFSKI
jgi:hypothetical protein